MRIGGHVSIAGGFALAVERQRLIGGTCGQTFLSGPGSWRFGTPKDNDTTAFKTNACAQDIGPWFAHAIYLINLASSEERIWESSIKSLTSHRETGARVNYSGIVLHTGSHKGEGIEAVLPRVATALERILAAQQEGPMLLLEVTAGQNGSIGATFEELALIIRALGYDDRIGVCWDTCHLFAAGFDVTNADVIAQMLDAFDSSIGMQRLRAVHANDSLFPLGSHRDRHANIGEGAIGDAGFEQLLAQPSLRQLPWILEVPGNDKSGPDLANINRLRRLAGLDPMPTPESAQALPSA